MFGEILNALLVICFFCPIIPIMILGAAASSLFQRQRAKAKAQE